MLVDVNFSDKFNKVARFFPHRQKVSSQMPTCHHFVKVHTISWFLIEMGFGAFYSFFSSLCRTYPATNNFVPIRFELPEKLRESLGTFSES